MEIAGFALSLALLIATVCAVFYAVVLLVFEKSRA